MKQIFRFLPVLIITLFTGNSMAQNSTMENLTPLGVAGLPLIEAPAWGQPSLMPQEYGMSIKNAGINPAEFFLVNPKPGQHYLFLGINHWNSYMNAAVPTGLTKFQKQLRLVERLATITKTPEQGELNQAFLGGGVQGVIFDDPPAADVFFWNAGFLQSNNNVRCGDWNGKLVPQLMYGTGRFSNGSIFGEGLPGVGDGGHFVMQWMSSQGPVFSDFDPKYHGLKYQKSNGSWASCLDLNQDPQTASAYQYSDLLLADSVDISHCNISHYRDYLQANNQIDWWATTKIPQIKKNMGATILCSGCELRTSFEGRYLLDFNDPYISGLIEDLLVAYAIGDVLAVETAETSVANLWGQTREWFNQNVLPGDGPISVLTFTDIHGRPYNMVGIQKYELVIPPHSAPIIIGTGKQLRSPLMVAGIESSATIRLDTTMYPAGTHTFKVWGESYADTTDGFVNQVKDLHYLTAGRLSPSNDSTRIWLYANFGIHDYWGVWGHGQLIDQLAITDTLIVTASPQQSEMVAKHEGVTATSSRKMWELLPRAQVAFVEGLRKSENSEDISIPILGQSGSGLRIVIKDGKRTVVFE